MAIGRWRVVCSLVIIGIVVHCVRSDNEVCRVDERLNMGLSKIQDPATILSVAYEYLSAPDCYHSCCNFTGNQCNAVSYYDKEHLCMLLSCRPFSNCVWVTSDGFTAARIRLTTDALPSPPPNPSSINNEMTSSTTSQGLAEGVTPTTTTQATPQTTQSPNPPAGGWDPSITQQPLNANPVQDSPLPGGTSSSEVYDWNLDNRGGGGGGRDEMMPSVETMPLGMNPIENPAVPPSEYTTTVAAAAAAAILPGGADNNQPNDQQQQQQQPFDNVIDTQPDTDWQSPIFDVPAAPANPNDGGGGESLDQPGGFTGEEEGNPIERPREMKRMFIQSPGIIIGLCSALGVAFLVLMAVCRKVYLSHDRPHYKPLRDYDIRFEPPAASSALLP